MFKRTLRGAIIFWGIVVLIPGCYIAYYFIMQSPWFYVARDGMASATTWLDTNGDGVQDPNEDIFANVCIWYGYGPDSGIREYGDPCHGHQFSTDQQGRWQDFLPGGSCEDYFVFAKVPQGFQPTTNLGSNACDAKFGFVPQETQVKQKILSVNEFVRQRILFMWFQRLFLGMIIVAIGLAGTFWLQKEP